MMLDEAMNEGLGFAKIEHFDRDSLLKACNKKAEDVIDEIGEKTGVYCVHFPAKNGLPELFWFVYVKISDYYSNGCLWNPAINAFSHTDDQDLTPIKRYSKLKYEDADKGCLISAKVFKNLHWSLFQYLDKRDGSGLKIEYQ